ncbi:MAG: xanthine dehydrogenase accessory protein XdhC [Sneathiella sp.]
MTNWTDIIKAYRAHKDCSVLVTVGSILGSTPRETGAKMLVTPTMTVGTIGGGQLEYLAIGQARESLENSESKTATVLKLPLGPELAQCCGGHVEVLLSPLNETDETWLSSLEDAQKSSTGILITNWNNETVTRRVVTNLLNVSTIDPSLLDGIEEVAQSHIPIVIRSDRLSENFTLIEPANEALFHLTLFGAGHVGKAVIHTLSQLPCTIDWIDERADMFPAELPENVQKTVSASPTHHISDAPANSFYLVMTHSHQLDLELCAEILKRGDSAYLGLIGSKTKRQKFRKRLTLRGFDERQLSDLTCPIGLENLEGKHPAQIAISVSAEIMKRQQERHHMGREKGKTAISLHN